MLDKNVAIKVEHLSKAFRIPHEKVSSLRGAFVGMCRGKRTFEEFQALDDVSFEVKKGEFFGIIGRNGSGKSTLLKILAGIYQPDKGKVTVNGMISPFLELGIGFNPELSGRDNVYLNATVLGLTKKQIDKKFHDIVAFSELERFIDQKLKNYSSGMQVRLAFSVAIHANRDILLMDEVLAVGDSNFQSKCLEEFSKYREMGRTVILVSHDISTIQRYCDRVLLLRNGRIMKVGEAVEVGNEYVHENMSDEEDRLENEEIDDMSISDESGKSTSMKKAIGIIKVEFLDRDGNTKRIFHMGDDITARIHYRVGKKIEKPVFGVAIYTQDGILIIGPNTKTSNFFVDDIVDDGCIDFILLKNTFFTGSYRFTAAIFDWECTIPFDFKDKLYGFRVVSRNENQNGLIGIDVLWKK